MASVQLIDTWEAARAACARLREHRLLALDMEGAPLATRASLLQLAVSPQEVYVFDVHTLGRGLFETAAYLLPILTDGSIHKLCYDCRGDGCALLQQFGVRASGMYDLQIVYASLRARAPGLLKLTPQLQPDMFLKGLHKAVAHILSPEAASAFAQRKREWKLEWQKTGAQNARVMQRPLAPDALAYAAADVEHLFALYREWAPYFLTLGVVHASDARLARATAAMDVGLMDSDDETVAMMKALIDFPPLQPRIRRLMFRYAPSSLTPRRAQLAAQRI